MIRRYSPLALAVLRGEAGDAQHVVEQARHHADRAALADPAGDLVVVRRTLRAVGRALLDQAEGSPVLEAHALDVAFAIDRVRDGVAVIGYARAALRWARAAGL